MIISNIGIKFIKRWEDLVLTAYQDQAGIWTIGYGTTRYFDGHPVREGDTIEEATAIMYLINECDGISRKLNSWLNRLLDQNKFDSLISLAYNIGASAFRTSTLLKEINHIREIKEDYFLRWDKIHLDGLLISSQGLRNRREAEWLLFSKGIYDVST